MKCSKNENDFYLSASKECIIDIGAQLLSAIAATAAQLSTIWLACSIRTRSIYELRLYQVWYHAASA